MTKSIKITKATSMELSTTPVLSDLELLKQELSGLAKISESNYIVDNCKIDGFTNTVQNETKIDALIMMNGSVSAKERVYNESMIDLGIQTAPVFSVNGHSAKSIKETIKLRIAIIEHADRKRELEELVKEAESFMTKADQYALFQAKLASKLKK